MRGRNQTRESGASVQTRATKLPLRSDRTVHAVSDWTCMQHFSVKQLTVGQRPRQAIGTRGVEGHRRLPGQVRDVGGGAARSDGGEKECEKELHGVLVMW